MMRKICLLFFLMAVCVEGQIWGNWLKIAATPGGTITRLSFDTITGTKHSTNGELWIYSELVGVRDADTIVFVPYCYAPLQLRSFKLKHGGGAYYYTLDSFTKNDSINGHWGWNDNTILEFRQNVQINNKPSSYLYVHTKTDLTDEAGRPILDGTVFWKALDTSMHIGSGDTAELTLYVPAPVVRAHDNQRAPGLKGWNIIHVNQTGWMQIPEHSQHIMISDMTGRVCLSVNTTNLLRNEIKVSDLSVGIYIVRINTTASIISRSITVSR